MSTKTDVFIDGTGIAWEEMGGGIRRKILGYDPTMMMTVVDFTKGAVGAIHHHPHTQVTYVQRGSFEVEIDGKKKILRAGDCFLIPSDVKHGVVALEDATLIDVFTPIREDFLHKK